MFQSTPPREGRRTARAISLSSTGFNPRPHARGDFGSPLRSCAIKMFQSTPHARGDEAGKPHLTGSLSFNPRPHTRGDVVDYILMVYNCEFQSTPPHEGRLDIFESHGIARKFQSTPPHEGRRIRRQVICTCSVVSIHAPTRGATFCLLIEIRF